MQIKFASVVIVVLLMVGASIQKSLAVPPAGGTCIVSSDRTKNIGSCEKNVGQPGDTCVACGFWDDCNCSGTNVPAQ